MCWSIVLKEKPTVGSPLSRPFPSDRVPKATKDVNVHFFIQFYLLGWTHNGQSRRIEKNSIIKLPLPTCTLNILLRGGDDADDNAFHPEHWLFCGSYKNTTFRTLRLCRQGICCLYQTYGWWQWKFSFMFLFVRASAFQVPNGGKRGACSTHHEEYCDFLQKFPTCDTIWFTDFPLSHFTTSYMHDICFICWRWWATTTWIIVNGLASIMGTFMPVIHLKLFHCSVIIRLLQHDWYLYCWFLQKNTKFYIRMLLNYRNSHLRRDLTHAKQTNNCGYAVRGYETAKLFLWWRKGWCQFTLQKFLSFSNSCKLYQQNPKCFWSNYVLSEFIFYFTPFIKGNPGIGFTVRITSFTPIHFHLLYHLQWFFHVMLLTFAVEEMCLHTLKKYTSKEHCVLRCRIPARCFFIRY